MGTSNVEQNKVGGVTHNPNPTPHIPTCKHTALTSLLFVATDSSSLLYFTPTPTDTATRVQTGASARPSSYYTTLSYKEEGVRRREHGSH